MKKFIKVHGDGNKEVWINVDHIIDIRHTGSNISLAFVRTTNGLIAVRESVENLLEQINNN